MKVKKINSSSRKTNLAIKKAFAELMKEKKELSKITVTELVKRADITRGTFYTHYDDIYDLATEYQEETIEFLQDSENDLYDIEDIYKFFDNIFLVLKENENIYRMLLTSDEPLIFIDKLKKIACLKIYNCLIRNNYNDKYIKLNISFFVDGILIQILRYFRETNYFTLEEITTLSKTLFDKIFFNNK